MLNLQRENRIQDILSSLKTLDYLCTSQLQKLHDLGGDRNARRVMSGLSKYVSNFRDFENIYYLNKAGREYIGGGRELKKLSTVDHYLMRNDFYIKNLPEEFYPERIIKVGKLEIKPDAWIKLRGGYYFLEVDNTQRMVKNKLKAEKYKKLRDTGAFQQQYGYFPRILWVTKLPSRKKLLKELMGDLKHTIILWEELK